MNVRDRMSRSSLSLVVGNHIRRSGIFRTIAPRPVRLNVVVVVGESIRLSVRLIANPSPGDGVKRGRLLELRQVDGSIEEFHDVGVVIGGASVVVIVFPASLPRRLLLSGRQRLFHLLVGFASRAAAAFASRSDDTLKRGVEFLTSRLHFRRRGNHFLSESVCAPCSSGVCFVLLPLLIHRHYSAF